MINDAESENESAGDEPPAENMASTSSHHLHDAYARIPEIGRWHRWYDLPYRTLSWLLPFNDHERHKVCSLDDPRENVFVPDEEHVNVPGIWMVELFPPSEFASLEDVLDRNS